LPEETQRDIKEQEKKFEETFKLEKGTIEKISSKRKRGC